MSDLIKMNSRDLIGDALDWATSVAAGCERLFWCNWSDQPDTDDGVFTPSTNWAQGGPIIEREGINLIRASDDYAIDERGFTTRQRIPVWVAEHTPGGQQAMGLDDLGGRCAWWFEEKAAIYGPTALIAALRSFVVSKLGNEVAVPTQLLSGKPESSAALVD